MTLSAEDRAHLATLEAKMVIVRDRTRSVALRLTTGFFLHGTGGIGKSFVVLGELDRLGADYKLWNSRMTGWGLFNVLKEFPDSIHVLEDMERIFRDTMAQGVLRSALWGQKKDGEMVRLVTWNAHGKQGDFYFTGGIIILANRPFHDIPELQAVATRINPAQLHVSNPEVAALMRHIASQGHTHGGLSLTPQQCSEVCEFIISEIAAVSRNLDLRLLHNSFADRIQWEQGEACAHWQELVRSRLEERVIPVVRERRSERVEREREIARQIRDLPREERADKWRQLTGKSEKALYRRLREI